MKEKNLSKNHPNFKALDEDSLENVSGGYRLVWHMGYDLNVSPEESAYLRKQGYSSSFDRNSMKSYYTDSKGNKISDGQIMSILSQGGFHNEGTIS